MNAKNRLIAIAAIPLFLSSGSAMAIGPKIHNGSMCQPANGQDRLDTFSGGAFNPASQNKFIFVTCPIVRDSTQNTDGTRLAFVNVRSSGGQSLNCTLVSRDKNGIFIEQKSASTTSSTPVSLNVDVNASAVLGTYALTCQLPPGGTIMTYYIDEFDEF
jgi:hypothetical protein